MIAAGWLEEAELLRTRGDLSPALPALRAVGYPQWFAHLDGTLSFEAARAGLCRHPAAGSAPADLAPGLGWLERLPLDADFALPSVSSLAKAFHRP